MGDSFSVRPEDVTRRAWDLIDKVTDSKAEHAEHHDAIGEAAAGWIGESAKALARAQQQWAGQADALHKRLGEMGTWMQENAAKFTAAEDRNRQNIDAIDKLDG